MTIKPDPAKTIFWSRLSTRLHSNGIRAQRGKKPLEEEQTNPPFLHLQGKDAKVAEEAETRKTWCIAAVGRRQKRPISVPLPPSQWHQWLVGGPESRNWC